ncbi:inorganic phosphate transporter [Methylobacterium sp. GXF4]|uniref:inorganic phosphate transporter n=1 Tax=Methylobacterium sp. GXF4 TaxID=1096546 RepID=UPI0002E7292E|nr:inorganic phosphate transporter [Methylobacterium sp. GXF4]
MARCATVIRLCANRSPQLNGARAAMIASAAPGSTLVLVLLIVALVLVLAFEFSNGFHDTANAVATVIYTGTLKPMQAVVWSGLMNFLGVMLGGIAVAYTLVELVPPDVLPPPNGGQAVGMLAALLVSALAWNVGTWWLGLPNSSSHALIGALIGIAVEHALAQGRGLQEGVDWSEVRGVLGSLLTSPVLGFALAFGLFRLIARTAHDRRLYEPPRDGEVPVWWMRGILVLTCTGVSFAHGTNDGQKSIGLIMLAIIGLFPADYALNSSMGGDTLAALGRRMPEIDRLIARYGGDRKEEGAAAVRSMAERLSTAASVADLSPEDRTTLRHHLNQVSEQLKRIGEDRKVPEAQRAEAKAAHTEIGRSVEYAPWWVRALSAVFLGAGTMVGYRRIVTTLGERLGNSHLVPAQGAAAELVAAGLIGAAGFTGFPVSTTHVVTGGIAGTMAGARVGVQRPMLRQIATAWALTLPATMALSATTFWLLS